METFGTTAEQLAAVAVKNHFYGSLNPNAMFRKEITLEKALASETVASPFRVYDCCANADGAACILLASEDRVRALSADVVWLDGVGCASSSMSVLRRPDLNGLPAAVDAAEQAYRMSETGPPNIKVAEVHDCFTIAEILAYEDLGFCARGHGGRFVAEGRSRLEGDTPTNVDGGLKAKGHPIGATGVSMAYEIVQQLRGRCGDRQVPGADIGLTHNVGGIGQYCFVNIYRRG
jgi:acetyl-CoA C-acetyltransferase